MALMKLNFLPGVNKENTPYTQEGGWVDSDKIRFRSGKPEKIGGWTKYIQDQLIGTPRVSRIWRALNGEIYSAFATQYKVYVETGGSVTDITPVRETQALTNPFDTTLGSAVITVNDTSHGAEDGAYVTISGSAAVGGIPDTEINAEHQITYVDANTYTITVTTPATSAVTGGGGASVSIEYQINPGPVNGVYQFGWGSGTWGLSTWGTARTGQGVPLDARMWSMTNWGEDLVFNFRGGPVFIWDASAPGDRATQITEAPYKVNYVLVTKDRHMACFGCNEAGTANESTDLDTMMIRWSSQEDYTDWAPTSVNTAGFQQLTVGTEIIAAASTESQVMVWTDDAVESMQYVGPPYTFSFSQIGTSTGLIGPNAWVSYNNIMYWMGDNAFYVYQGGTSVLPCTVQKFVFDDLNIQQKFKCFAALDRENHEITWFYSTNDLEPTYLNGAISDSDTTITVDTTAGFDSSGCLQIDNEKISYTGKTDSSFTGVSRGQLNTTAASHDNGAEVFCPNMAGPSEPCRYVSYNVIDQIWWVGRLERSSWTDRGALPYPLATRPDGYIFYHEYGYDADTEPMVAYIESGDFDIGEGDSLMFIHRVIPDFFVTGSVDLQMRTRNYPLSPQVQDNIGTVTSSTTKINTRIRGREMSLRIESDDVGDYWKYGSTRIDQRTDGRR